MLFCVGWLIFSPMFFLIFEALMNVPFLFFIFLILMTLDFSRELGGFCLRNEPTYGIIYACKEVI